ncbi:hypothetical protein A2973_01265 [Candidatus Gottesmanbacteria bacterium RIFCSPLOWO2_01_FULL_49_10]|uniref:Uncharacterized protein n=1 Tax=Candidatus Gottesmanbacteria bacterium RIFCSPLOWO2_01_FULL_49_10 TaxID=1798396 RepID=A0A1F6AX73_9BACT|nr:MAG: hypothetical protein A2973_01265 [Candidatus Gottesmanbacteria bacterium RIFCSPLOWO2_01_FULL_49_10]
MKLLSPLLQVSRLYLIAGIVALVVMVKVIASGQEGVYIRNNCTLGEQKEYPRDHIDVSGGPEKALYSHRLYRFHFSVPSRGMTSEENVVDRYEEQIAFPRLAYSLVFKESDTRSADTIRFLIYPDNCQTPERWISSVPTQYPRAFSKTEKSGLVWYVSRDDRGSGYREKFFTHGNGYHYEFELTVPGGGTHSTIENVTQEIRSTFALK